jgi:hypothetical protein
MVTYVAQRLIAIVFILFVMSLLIFGITQVMPGNVAHMIAGQFATPDVVAAIEAKLGLRDPIYVQYWRWASGVLHGDLGQSLIMERPVGPMIQEAMARSAILAGLAFVCVAVIGIALGVIAAVRKDTATDNAISVFTYLGISVPEFFWGIVLILVFARYLNWLPSGGIGDPAFGLPVDPRYLILPAITLTFALIAHVSRLTRSSMLEALRSTTCASRAPRDDREPGGAPPRPAQCAAADHNGAGDRCRLPDRRHRRGRNGILLSGLGAAAPVRHRAPRPAADPGQHSRGRGHLLLGQSGGRYPLRLFQPEDPLWPARPLRAAACKLARPGRRARACRASWW